MLNLRSLYSRELNQDKAIVSEDPRSPLFRINKAQKKESDKTIDLTESTDLMVKAENPNLNHVPHSEDSVSRDSSDIAVSLKILSKEISKV